MKIYSAVRFSSLVRVALAVCVFMLALCAVAAADTLTISGNITQDAINSAISSPVHFTGYFTFNSSASDSIPADTHQGSYTSTGASYGVHIDDFGFGAFDSFSILNIGTLASASHSSYTVFSSDSGLLSDCNTSALCVTIDLEGAGGVLVNDSLSTPIPGLFSSAQIRIYDNDDNNLLDYMGTVTTVGNAPEPSSLVLLISGAAALAGKFGRQRS